MSVYLKLDIPATEWLEENQENLTNVEGYDLRDWFNNREENMVLVFHNMNQESIGVIENRRHLDVLLDDPQPIEFFQVKADLLKDKFNSPNTLRYILEDMDN